MRDKTLIPRRCLGEELKSHLVPNLLRDASQGLESFQNGKYKEVWQWRFRRHKGRAGPVEHAFLGSQCSSVTKSKTSRLLPDCRVYVKVLTT